MIQEGSVRRAQAVGNEELQKTHYDLIAGEYDLHYSDEYSQRYRTQFINEPLTHGIDLRGRDVLEALCGTGNVTEHLIAKGARVTGLDISERMLNIFAERWPDCKTILASILDSGIPDGTYDAIVIVGGLHHLHPDVQPAVTEMCRILKPGGYLCFMEPHTGSVPDLFRRMWYRFDRLFEKNEAAVDIAGLQAANADRFEFVKTRYLGNIAFLLVLNSLVFRIPVRLKRYYTPPLLVLESLIGRFQGKRFSCFAVSQWRKTVHRAPESGSAEDGAGLEQSA